MTSVYPLAAVALLAVLIGVGIAIVVVMARTARRSQVNQSVDLEDPQGGYPEGHWMGIGISVGLLIGMALGMAMGIATDSVSTGIALGPAMGVAIGVAIGAGLEQRHKDEIRPLTEDERRSRSRLMWVGVAALAVGLLVLASIFVATLL